MIFAPHQIEFGCPNHEGWGGGQAVCHVWERAGL